MAGVKDIVLAPAEVLEVECAPIEKIDAGVRRLAKRMLRDMYAADGCGLAAPQVGEAVQLVVIDVDYAGEDGKKNPYVLINPRIIEASGEEVTTNEGCLSFPGIAVPVTRPGHVVVQALNLEGDLMQYEAEHNLLCTCLQHEIDHLHGVTMLDHLSASERARALLSYQEALAAGAEPGDTGQEEA